MKTLAAIALLSVPACSWNGFYAGAQVVAPFEASPSHDAASVYGTAIWNLPAKSSLQIQVSQPVNGEPPLYRVAVDTKIF